MADELVRETTWNDAGGISSAIHDLDPEHRAVETFAAGPVENLLAYQGVFVIDAVETKARQYPGFAFVLVGVWQNAIPEPIWQRVLACRNRRGWDCIK